MTLSKSIRVRFPVETGRLQIRGDFFNTWNHTQWGPAVNSTLQSGNVNAGRISSTRPPRHIQLSLKWAF